jgi:hypothetical protein
MKFQSAIVFTFIFFLITAPKAEAQKITNATKKQLAQVEDSLKTISRTMVFSNSTAERFRADSNFIRTLMRALKQPYSFEYPFDSVSVSKIVAPDSSFRILTWQVKKDEYTVLQKGVIQKNTPDGSLVRYPLFDNSMFTSKVLDSVRTPSNWIGAIYYKIIQKSFQGKNYYTLLGFDEYTINTNRKWMEVLSFDAEGQPVFGGPLFSFEEDSIKKPVQARYAIEYKKEAKAYLNFDAELDIVILDHLISETDEPEKKFTYIPDGDYEGFKWKNGRWVHIDKVFDFQLKDGDSPTEAALYDSNGNINEETLGKKSQSNDEKNKTDSKPTSSPKLPTKTIVPKKTGGN